MGSPARVRALRYRPPHVPLAFPSESGRRARRSKRLLRVDCNAMGCERGALRAPWVAIVGSTCDAGAPMPPPLAAWSFFLAESLKTHHFACDNPGPSPGRLARRPLKKTKVERLEPSTSVPRRRTRPRLSRGSTRPSVRCSADALRPHRPVDALWTRWGRAGDALWTRCGRGQFLRFGNAYVPCGLPDHPVSLCRLRPLSMRRWMPPKPSE